MTKHCLIRSTLAAVLKSAAQRHAQDDLDSGTGIANLPHWRYKPGASTDKTVVWRSGAADGSIVNWCLEVEQGANGVLAHLSAVAVAGPMTRLPRSVGRFALQAWTGVELHGLAKVTESSTTATQPWEGTSDLSVHNAPPVPGAARV